MVPETRIRFLNDAPARDGGRYVLYWMIGERRTRRSFAIDRALEHCAELRRPLLVFEPLRAGYRYASDRIHRFVMDGMEDNAKRLAKARGVSYLPYVEPSPGAGKGLLGALAKDACVVVTDDKPTFFLPRMAAAAGRALPVRLEAVDGNGILPIAATERVFSTAYSFRRFLQKNLRPHLDTLPRAQPFRGTSLPPAPKLPAGIAERWPSAASTADVRIDHGVAPAHVRGGPIEAERRLDRWLELGLPRYADDRNQPEADVTSGLSPYLHFGHVSPHDVFARIAKAEEWAPDRLADHAKGSRAGWWGTGESAEGFLDQLITWRELGFHTSAKLPRHDEYDSLPAWAKETLRDHENDPREHVYTPAEFEEARTHDELWNAAQRQLRREGKIHNYLRMVWGKKILEWSATPRDALATMLHQNDRFALDGRDPNSVSGIFWCLGRYDRAWGPERPVFGKIRYMSTANTARKVKVKGYLERYGERGLFG